MSEHGRESVQVEDRVCGAVLGDLGRLTHAGGGVHDVVKRSHLYQTNFLHRLCQLFRICHDGYYHHHPLDQPVGRLRFQVELVNLFKDLGLQAISVYQISLTFGITLILMKKQSL